MLPGVPCLRVVWIGIASGLLLEASSTRAHGHGRLDLVSETRGEGSGTAFSLSLLQREAGAMSAAVRLNRSVGSSSLPWGGVASNIANLWPFHKEEPMAAPVIESPSSQYGFTYVSEPTYMLKKACTDCEVKINPEPEQPRQCGIAWFYHIPKCGGESVNWWLFRMKEQLEFDDVLLLHSMDHVIDFQRFQENQLDPFLKSPRGKLIAVHHHDRGPGLFGLDSQFKSIKKKLQAQGCDLYRFTFLREPESLLKSTLVFFDSAEHQKNYEWVAPEPVRNIEDPKERFQVAMQTDAIYDNLMVRYILNNRLENDGPNPRHSGAKYPLGVGEVSDEALAEAWNILSQFDFIGFLENMESGLYAIAKDLGFRSIVVLKAHNVYGIDQANMAAATSSTAFDDILTMDDMQSLIEQRTDKDKELYDSAKTLVETRAADAAAAAEEAAQKKAMTKAKPTNAENDTDKSS